MVMQDPDSLISRNPHSVFDPAPHKATVVMTVIEPYGEINTLSFTNVPVALVHHVIDEINSAP